MAENFHVKDFYDHKILRVGAKQNILRRRLKITSGVNEVKWAYSSYPTIDQCLSSSLYVADIY